MMASWQTARLLSALPRTQDLAPVPELAAGVSKFQCPGSSNNRSETTALVRALATTDGIAQQRLVKFTSDDKQNEMLGSLSTLSHVQ